jgi:uncharacterized membrane protein YfcA
MMFMNALMILLGLLGLITAVFCFFFFKDVVAHKDEAAVGANGANSPLWISGIIGAVTNFFDTLGIGSFAPTTALFKATKVVDDEVIPGTLNVAHTLPVILMAFMYIDSVEVEFVTLATLIAASAIGAWIGAGVVAKFNRKTIQLIMGVALLLTAGLMIARTTGIIAGFGTGEAIGLSGVMLIVGIIAHFILGALMTAGVGLYAPSMAVIFLLGLSPAVAFPIMMGACAFLMPVAGVKFVKEGKYARKQSLAIGILSIPGVLLAHFIFSGLDISMLVWLVIGVILITSVTMIHSYMKSNS